MKQSDLMLIGAAALGALLLSGKKKPAARPPASPPDPNVINLPPVIITGDPPQPQTPAPSPPALPSGPVELQRVSGSYPLEQGRRYRALVQLSTFEAAFASPELVADRFARVGFSDITCRSLGGGAYELEGTWSGPSGSYPAPQQITRVWRL